ncbi:MAG: hypothetical protein C5B51_28105 [Terriglobia bacterium]|nr:MAG: hypothetical protein C5B51_28105 [Terriglobia bacterium]
MYGSIQLRSGYSSLPSIYAIQFDVVPDKAQDARTEFDQIKERITTWVVAGYDRKWNVKVRFPKSGESIAPFPGHVVHVTEVELGDAAMQRTRWAHPDGSDAHLQWTTDVVVAITMGEKIQFGMQVGVSSTSYIVRPAQISLGRPRLVSDLFSNHSCWAGDQPLLMKKLEISAQDVADFVEGELLDQKRRIPIVVVSHDQFTDRPVIDADRLHKALLGFAQVAVFDKWAAFQLTDTLGRALSCFNGCVRIYWPGLKRDSNPLHHWLYFPTQMERFEYQKKPIEKRLFDYLARVSAARFTDASIARDIQARVDAERAIELNRIQKQLQEGRAAANSLQEVQELLDLAIKENAELNERVTVLQSDNENLAAQLQDVRDNFSVFQQHQALESEAAVEHAQQVEYGTVSTALSAAERDFATDFLILETARRSAEESEFARPEEVYRALMAIRDVGRLYFESLESDTSIGSWAEQLKRRNFTQYSASESATVKNDYRKYARYREFAINGEKRRIYQHLDLGGGDRKNCLQIYFDADRDLKRIIVAHCGVHLPIPSQRT